MIILVDTNVIGPKVNTQKLFNNGNKVILTDNFIFEKIKANNSSSLKDTFSQYVDYEDQFLFLDGIGNLIRYEIKQNKILSELEDVERTYKSQLNIILNQHHDDQMRYKLLLQFCSF